MRTKLADRRSNMTVRIPYTKANGQTIYILVTFGYDRTGRPLEVFCADFKAGSETQALIMDACILLSRLLQHGDSPHELAESMCSPPSLIGSIAQAMDSLHSAMG